MPPLMPVPVIFFLVLVENCRPPPLVWLRFPVVDDGKGDVASVGGRQWPL